ncbi:filamin-A-like isoform X4 [Amphibalanus amphitrite]|uniref:filamin-A-like isoform X4 n=1 Tax=Amphibalanus amphitrite TaxID=1232801 RepID=UPI001C91425B|nr:filamin-A-like isoform X4 [Amphibalanus amphitrite]
MPKTALVSLTMASNGFETEHAASAGRDPPEEEEMLAEERDLAEDAQWKRIQQNTFTRWANEHLKNASKHIYSLETDLEDGLILIALIEVLSGKKMPKHSKRPTFRSQKLENVSVALKFLERDENIKIVNIDATHIVDCHLKLILGLIWTLILHYSISMPMWEGDENVPGEKGPTPKQRLMNWIGSKMPDLPVRNFTSDWRDGKAIGALVDGVAPGLCPDWSDWRPEDALKNATEAMGLADDWLNVPQLIQPEDMIDPNVDELSMMTYLSQYPNAKLKAGAPLRAKTNPNRVRCYGPGVEPTGPVVGAPTFFTVETFSAGQGKVECFLIRPNGQKEPIEAKFNNDRNLTYSCSYTPTSEGQHRVIVKFIGNEIPKSPFSVQVEGYAGDPNKVTASGPGLEPVGVVVSKPTYFDIFTHDAGKGTPEVVILDPKGKQNPAMLKLKEVKQGQWRCEYLADQVGMYSINIYFATKPIPKSPFGVKVSPACDPRRVKATGRGLQNKGVRVGEIADFKLWTEGAGEGVPKVRIIGPGGADEPAELRKVSDFVYEGAYYPKREGRYIVMITYSGHEIPRSPFEVNVGPKGESRIRCYGPGLKGGVVGSPAAFTVETNGETGALGFSVEGPSQAQIQCHDNGDGSADVTYLPTAPGEYAVHVLCEGEDIPQSPWMAQVIPKTDYDASKVRVFGPGVQKDGVSVNKPTHFTVDTTAAGSAPLDISLLDEDLREVPMKITEKSPGVFHVEYTISTSGKHTVMVNFGGVAVPNSPFRVDVTAPVDASKVQVFGPGLEPGVRAQVPTHFNVDARGAGPAELRIGLKDNKTGKEVPVQLTDNGDGTMTADYVYPRPGPYTLNVTYGGRAIPQSPVNIEAKPSVDTSKIRVDGVEPTAFLNSPTDMVVDARAVPGSKDGKVTCPVTGPSGAPCPSHVEPVGDGTFKATYTPTEPGPHKIDLAYDGAPVPGAPFTVNAKPGCDPRKVTADGPGLKRGIVNKSNTFKINTRGAGTGGLGLAIEGPSEAKMSCVDNKDGSCTVEYVPTEPGEYDVNVRYADQHIPGSPFKVPVDCEVDADNVVAYGPGVEPEHCRANVPLTFTVDATRSAPAPLAVEVKSDKGPLPRKPVVKDNGDGTYDVTYHPPPEGSICMPRVTLAGRDIKDSPWRMPVKPTCEPNKVRLTGPGVSSKGVPASLPTEFTVDARDAGFGDLEAQILGPDNYPRKVEMVDNGDGTYTGRYTPDDCGQYKVHVKYGGKEVAGSPVPVQAFATGHADKCKIEDSDYRDQVLSVGEEYCISVDAKQAGNGNVTCRIRSTSGSGDVDIDVTDNGDGTFNIYYKVKDAGEYSLNIKFGGQPVPDGLYSFSAQSEDNVSRTRTEHLQSSATTTSTSSTVHTREEYFEYRPVELNNIPLPTTGGHVTAEVNMPSGNVDKPLIEDNRDGTVSVKYEPKEEGLHELVVKYNGENVQGSPFKFHVDSISSGYVTAHGPGLVHGITGEPANFTISTKDAGAGGLSLAVEGPSKAEISCHDNKDGTVSVSYLPTSPGEYKVAVKFADKHIKGSPYSVKVTGEGRKRNQVSLGSQSEVTLPGKVTEKDIKALNASITAPSGLEEPCFLKKLANDHLGISFTPREIGQHLVMVKKKGVEIAGSPFKIVVSPKEVGDASKVKVEGAALKEGKTHQDNKVLIDTKEAGYGGLSMSIEGPSKAEIKCDDKDDGRLEVSYNPKEPGFYIINLKFADHHVEGSPFTAKVTGEGSNTQTERIKRDRDAAPITTVGSSCALTFKMPGVSALDLSATVASPGGVVEDATITELEDNLHAVNFVPKELGVHTVSVRYRDVHIPGSPFQFTVGPLKDGGAHRVHAGGPGLERGEQNMPNEFNVWTREAGAGSLAISVEGPSKAEIDFKDRKDGSCYVSYIVSEPGEYRVGVKFNDSHIPESPYKVYVTPANKDAHRVSVNQLPDAGVQVDKPIVFTVDRSGCKGQLDCKVVSPSGHEDDCFAQYLDEDTYSVRFLPKENGIHQLHVKWNSVHVPGSPFRLKIGKQDADPAAIHAHGKGLEKGTTGQKSDFIVDTCNAGAGTLAVTVDGPSKVAMDCTEVDEGYKVRYTPLSPGHYYVGIKYDGYHIAGSPFKVDVDGEELAERGPKEQSLVVVETIEKVSARKQENKGPSMPKFNSDATKVTSKGMGLKKAFVGRQNQFTVDAGKAGQDMLWVGCFGPKNPCEEVHIKHIGRNQYQVFYTVKERGKYILVVRWGENDIPGSPFEVEV